MHEFLADVECFLGRVDRMFFRCRMNLCAKFDGGGGDLSKHNGDVYDARIVDENGMTKCAMIVGEKRELAQ